MQPVFKKRQRQRHIGKPLEQLSQFATLRERGELARSSRRPVNAARHVPTVRSEHILTSIGAEELRVVQTSGEMTQLLLDLSL